MEKDLLLKANEPIEGEYYTPIIRELTIKEMKRAKLKHRLKYVLKILNYFLLLGVGMTFVYPFLWMFSMSIRPLHEALLFPPSLIVTEPNGKL